LKAELAGLQENYEKLKDQYDKADAVVSARNQASQEYSDLTARIRAGENNLEQLQSERDQLLVVLQDARSKRSTEQQAVSTLQQQKLDLTTETGDLLLKKRELEALNKELSSLQKEKVSLENDSARLTTDIGDAQTRLIDLKSQVADAKSELTTVDTSVRDKKTDATVLGADAVRLQEQVVTLELKLRGLSSEYTTLLDLQKQTAQANAENDQLLSSIAKLKAQKTVADSELRDVKNSLSNGLADVQRIKQREEALLGKEARLGDLDSAASMRQAQLDELNKSLSESRAELSKIHAKVSALGEREARVAERERQAAAREEAVQIKETQVEVK
jgi:chromosome segregation ATPase